jgi:hypothetical protein
MFSNIELQHDIYHPLVYNFSQTKYLLNICRQPIIQADTKVSSMSYTKYSQFGLFDKVVCGPYVTTL